MFYKENGGVEVGSYFPNEARVDGEPEDVVFVARVQEYGRSRAGEMFLVDQITERESLGVGEIEVIQSSVEPTRVVFGRCTMVRNKVILRQNDALSHELGSK